MRKCLKKSLCSFINMSEHSVGCVELRKCKTVSNGAMIQKETCIYISRRSSYITPTHTSESHLVKCAALLITQCVGYHSRHRLVQTSNDKGRNNSNVCARQYIAGFRWNVSCMEEHEILPVINTRNGAIVSKTARRKLRMSLEYHHSTPLLSPTEYILNNSLPLSA